MHAKGQAAALSITVDCLVVVLSLHAQHAAHSQKTVLALASQLALTANG